MRNAYIEALTQAADHDDSIFLVVGDLGYSVIEPFRQTHPDRFLNVGVAEQNMTAVACGLAREGYHVFTYSIGNFATLRCLEQIRNDVCYHQLPVCVTAVGGGFMYGSLGATHHATEDIAIMRTLPHMRVFVPFCQASARCVLDEVLSEKSPAYVRIGRQAMAFDDVSGNGLIPLSKADGSKSAVISVGPVSPWTHDLARESNADLYALCRIQPLPEEALLNMKDRYKNLTVVEDHQRAGGAFSAVSELFSNLSSWAIDGEFVQEADREQGLREKYICLRQRSGPI